MSATLRPTLSKVIPLVLLTAAAALSIAVVMNRHDAATETSAPAASQAASLPVAMIVAATLEPRMPELMATGWEPDPAAFDQAGLDSWWRNYQRAHPRTAALSTQ